MKRVGIDVGGTNTDAVLLDGERVVAAVKTPTTADVTSGITRALADLLAAAPAAARVDAVMIGTTHFTNAVVQRRGLTRIAAVRIGLPASASLPPFVDWPDDLAELVRGEVVMLEGGHEYDGRPIVPFDAAGMRAAARRFREAGVTSVAVASVFSRSTRPARSRRRRSSPRSAPTPRSRSRTAWAASGSSSARTSPCSTRACWTSPGRPRAPSSTRCAPAASSRRSTSRRTTVP